MHLGDGIGRAVENNGALVQEIRVADTNTVRV
jgi:hypothetical protein